MGDQERLDSLSLLCIEADMLRSVDLDAVIKDFACQGNGRFELWTAL